MNELDLNLNLYRNFYYVAKYGGFTNASIHAHISQSALSISAKTLEKNLNKKLFIRNSAKITLTNDGKELFLKLEKIKNIFNSNLNYNDLKIGCSRFIADNYLDNIICKYRKKDSKLKLSMVFSNTTEMFQMLKKEEVDLIICRLPLFYKFDNYINVEKILEAENVFVCSKQYYESEKEKMKSNDYIFQMILPDSSEKRRNIEQYLFENKTKYNVIIELPSSNLLKKLITSNQGIGFINKKFVEEEIKNNKIVVLDNFKNIPKDIITIIYNSNNNNENLKEFIKILKNNI